MGKRLIQQARGKGGPRYRAPSFNYVGRARFPNKVKEGKIIDFIKCPGHSAPLAAIEYDNSSVGLMIAPEGLRVGQKISLETASEIKLGSVLELNSIPEGTLIFNIENTPGDGGKFVRASGTFAKILTHADGITTIQLPSKKNKTFNSKCRAAIGTVAGGGRLDKPFLKAGKKHHAMKAKNRLYPSVSGTSMNSVDHPFGGTKTSHKGRPLNAPKNAPPGRKVGKLRARRTGRKK